MNSTYPAITIWQPHASLIFSGHKLYETRSWSCPGKYIGERIAIHAGKNLSDIKEVRDGFCSHHFEEAIKEAFGSVDALPLGCVLGTAILESCISTEWLRDPNSFDDFSPGRYAWGFRDPQLLKEPVPMKGAQGFWKLKVFEERKE